MYLRIGLVLCLLLSNNSNLYGSQLIKGDSTTSTATTSFTIGTHAFDIIGGSQSNPSMYIGANAAIADNQYAIARANPKTNLLEALAPANINLNGATEKDSKNNIIPKLETNPLYGAKIDFLKLNNGKPVVVKNGDITVYAYTTAGGTPTLISSDEKVLDANGAETGSIVELAAANGSKGEAFVACTPTTSTTFGAVGGGIALFENKIVNSITTLALQNNKEACALDNTSASIKITNDVVLNNAVEMHWDGGMQCLFIGLQATSGSTAGDGARSIVIGKVAQVTGQTYDEIVFEEFAPAALFTGNDQIIGTATAGSTVSAIKLKTMTTSTRLNYLIINGGNGAANAVGNKIYALPLVSGSNANKGHLAKLDQTPTNSFTANTNFFTGRTLDTAATVSADAPINSSNATKVGGGDLPLNATEEISDLFVAGDCVYASIGTTTATDATGIFYSQAIFDEQGLIANWTPWQQVGGSTNATFGAAINQTNSTFWFLNGADASSVNTIKRTAWGIGSNDGLLGGTTTNESLGLVANLGTLFPKASGGIFSILNTPKEDPALTIPLLIATGSEEVAIINTSAAVGGDFSAGLVQSTNDVIPTTTTASTVASIAGTNLTTLGPIVTSHIATNTGVSWILVGGAGGVAILRQTSGAGWSGTLADLSTLTASFKFEILGSYKYVKKITSDGTYLYILDQDKLDRIALINDDLITGTATTIAQVGTLDGTTTSDVFNDFVVSGNLGLLATSAGLYRTSNANDIKTGTNNWTAITVPEQRTVPCTKLISITPTGLDSGLVDNGNLYVLSSYRGQHQAQINRFYVNSSAAISDTTMQPLPDIYLKGTNSYFINFESFRDNFFTDGALLINSLSKDGTQDSYAHLMQPGILSGIPSFSLKTPYNIPLVDIDKANFISSIVRNSASGALLIGGQFGIQANE
jgi:hypothetical protein